MSSCLVLLKNRKGTLQTRIELCIFLFIYTTTTEANFAVHPPGERIREMKGPTTLSRRLTCNCNKMSLSMYMNCFIRYRLKFNIQFYFVSTKSYYCDIPFKVTSKKFLSPYVLYKKGISQII